MWKPKTTVRRMFGQCLRLLFGHCLMENVETEATVWTLDNVCHMEGCLLLAPTIQPHSALQLTGKLVQSTRTLPIFFGPAKFMSQVTKNQNGCMQSRYCSGNGHFWKRTKKPVYLSLTSVDGTQPTANFLAKLPPIKTLNRGLLAKSQPKMQKYRLSELNESASAINKPWRILCHQHPLW